MKVLVGLLLLLFVTGIVGFTSRRAAAAVADESCDDEEGQEESEEEFLARQRSAHPEDYTPELACEHGDTIDAVDDE